MTYEPIHDLECDNCKEPARFEIYKGIAFHHIDEEGCVEGELNTEMANVIRLCLVCAEQLEETMKEMIK